MASFCHSVPMITTDDANPTVMYIDRDAEPILVQISQDQYEVRQGRCLLGVVAFHDDRTTWGWRFYPRQNGKRASRALHPDPEAALRGRFVIAQVCTLSRTLSYVKPR